MSEHQQAVSASFTESLRGFAAMCRSGAMVADDGKMIAEKFEAALAEIERLQSHMNNLADECRKPKPDYLTMAGIIALAVNNR